MPGEDSEDTWASEDTFPAKTLLGAKTRGRPKTLPALAKALTGVKPRACEKTIELPKTGRAKARVVAKTPGHAKTRPEDRSGKDTCRREDTREGEDTSPRQAGKDTRRRGNTWAGEDTSQRQVWRRHASSRRHMGGRRRFPKTGLAKTQVVAKTCGCANTGRANTLIVAKTRGRHIKSRQPQPRDRPMQVVSIRGAACSRQMWHQSVASHANVASGRQLASPDVASKRGVRASPGVSSKRGVTCPLGVREPNGRQMWRQNVASIAQLASGSQLTSPDLASKRSVTCPPGVRKLGGVARCGVKTWRRRWRQNVASLAYVALGSQVASPAVPGFTPLIGLTCCQRTWRQNVASLAHVASESHVASPDVASEHGSRHHRPTWRRRTWRQDVTSGGPSLLAHVFKIGRYVHPHRRPRLYDAIQDDILAHET